MRELMMVPKNIISSQANKPVIGIVQDTLLGCRWGGGGAVVQAGTGIPGQQACHWRHAGRTPGLQVAGALLEVGLTVDSTRL